MCLLTVAVSGLAVSLFGIRFRRQIVGRQEIGVPRNERVQVGGHFAPLLELHLHKGALVTHLSPFGLQGEGGVEIGEGVVVVADLLPHHTAVVVTVCVTRGYLHCLIVV